MNAMFQPDQIIITQAVRNLYLSLHEYEQALGPDALRRYLEAEVEKLRTRRVTTKALYLRRRAIYNRKFGNRQWQQIQPTQ